MKLGKSVIGPQFFIMTQLSSVSHAKQLLFFYFDEKIKSAWQQLNLRSIVMAQLKLMEILKFRTGMEIYMTWLEEQSYRYADVAFQKTNLSVMAHIMDILNTKQ